MAEITKSYTGHSPSITVNWSYDPSTKKAKVYIKKQKDNEKIYIIHNITLTLL